METPTKLPPSSPSSPTTGFSVPSAEKVDGFPRRSMRRARQRRSHSSSQFRYQSSQVELTPLPLLKGRLVAGHSLSRNPFLQSLITQAKHTYSSLSFCMSFVWGICQMYFYSKTSDYFKVLARPREFNVTESHHE